MLDKIRDLLAAVAFMAMLMWGETIAEIIGKWIFG